MGMKRSLTTSYHPQANGQTEVMNQSLEISLRAYIRPSRDDWVDYLYGLSLAYNSMPHSSTGFSPAYLLRGYTPVTRLTLLSQQDSVPRPLGELNSDMDSVPFAVQNDRTQAMVNQFDADRTRAKEALLLAQVHQQRAYNNGRLLTEFEEGDQVVLNPHSLGLLKSEKGCGQKLLMKYDGPFEIIRKLSPVTYQLRLPASYGIHPVLNIAHLELYEASPPEYGEHPVKRLQHDDFDVKPEYEVDTIMGERWRKGPRGRRIQQFKTRFTGYGPEADEWLTHTNLWNSPEVLQAWEARMSERIERTQRTQPEGVCENVK